MNKSTVSQQLTFPDPTGVIVSGAYRNAQRLSWGSGRSLELSECIRRTWSRNSAVLSIFGGEQAFNCTLDKIAALDHEFRSTSGIYFHLGSSHAETARNFADTHLSYWQTGIRPSLPALAAHYLDGVGLSLEDPYYKAALLVATRGELDHVNRPQYHGPNHFSDVLAATIEFLKKNNELADAGIGAAFKLSPHELAVGVIAAAGHDLGHPGGKNTLPGEKLASDPFRLEKKSVEMIKVLVLEAGIPSKSIARIEATVLTTSPDLNGPRKLLAEIDKLHNRGEQIEWEKLAYHETFPDLNLLGTDPVVRVVSQNLRAADLAQSCMFGLRANEIATAALQAEWKSGGYPDQLLGNSRLLDGTVIREGQTIKARKGFLDFAAWGKEGPDAAGAQAAAGQNYSALYADTKAKLEIVQAEESAHAVQER
jgi:hypothetical protein